MFRFMSSGTTETALTDIPRAIIARVSFVKLGNYNAISTGMHAVVTIHWLTRLAHFGKMNNTWRLFGLVRPSRFFRRWMTTSNSV